MDFGKLFDTLKGPLLSVAANFIPGGPAILGLINDVLPEDKKLPTTATGADMRLAVNQLDPGQRASLMEKQLDIEIAEINSWEGVQASLAQADGIGSSTRPKIAMIMAWLIVFITVPVILIWVTAIYASDTETLQVINESWPVILTFIGTPTALLRAYFGMRTNEKKARYSAASGQPITGVIENLIGAIRK